MKRTTEEVKKYFLDHGCELLDEYTGCLKPMKYRCKCGKESKISWNNFTKGKRCGWCSKRRIKKYSLEEVKLIFEKRGCNLVSEFYTNKNCELKYICSCGNATKTTLSKFMYDKKYNCNLCAYNHCKNVSLSRKLKQEKVCEIFNKEGCKLKGVYENTNTPIDYICKCGREAKISVKNFKHGYRCGHCGKQRATKFTLEEVRKLFEESGCNFLDDHYVNNITPHKFKCSCGNEEYIKVQYFRRGVRCSNCKKLKRSGSNHFAWRNDRDAMELEKSFRKRIYGFLNRCYSKLGTEKELHSHDILGYSPKELKEHITNHTNWRNVKNGDWQIDHIFPINAFLDFGIFDIKLINCLDNLQPLLMFDNYSKNDTYNEKDFINWLSKHDIETVF